LSTKPGKSCQRFIWGAESTGAAAGG